MYIKTILVVGISVLLSACGLRSFPRPTPTITNTVSPQQQSAALVPVTPSPLPTVFSSVFQGPDNVVVPILLYHRIAVSPTDSQYYVSPEKFEEQIKLLRDWGYTTITTELLVKSINEGATLPLRPVVITFDDGHIATYTTAFPIMKKYGFTGVLYVVGKYMGKPEYMSVNQLKEMARAGWEVGSHSMRHLDLTTLDPEDQQYEIVESRRFLESELGMPVFTFSYPFGVSDLATLNFTYSAGYIAGMGIGYTNEQWKSYLFTLPRRNVNGTQDIKSFISYLPWQGDPVYMPTDTITPSPTSTSTPLPTNTKFLTSTSPP